MNKKLKNAIDSGYKLENKNINTETPANQENVIAGKKAIEASHITNPPSSGEEKDKEEEQDADAWRNEG